MLGYDRKGKKLMIEGRDKITLELSKPHANDFIKEIEYAHKRAREKLREKHLDEAVPELPERSTPSSPIRSPSRHSPFAAAIMRSLSPMSPMMGSSQFVLALYDYEPQEQDELRISEDERLKLIDDSSPDWWMVQRLEGNQKKGLVPASYVQRASFSPPKSPLEQIFEPEVPIILNRSCNEDEGEDHEVKSPKSTKSKTSRPGSPAITPSFLDELKARHRSRSPKAIEEEPKMIEETSLTVEPEPIVEQRPPTPPPMPKAFPSTEPKEGEAVALNDVPLSRKSSVREPIDPAIEPLCISRKTSIKIEPKEESISPVKEKPGSCFAVTKLVKSEPNPKAPAKTEPVEVVKAEQKPESQNHFQAPLPKLKPVQSDQKGLSALSSILLKKQEDIKVGQIRIPEPPKSPVAKENPNPWRNINVQVPRKERPSGPEQIALVNKALPSRPEQAHSSDKPKPIETRLWTSRNGQFQVEAKYLDYQCGKVNLHKLNGVKISVPIDQLCERDKEYVYRKEGIPWDQGVKKDFKVGAFDWLSFFMDANVDPTRARTYAQGCVDMKVGEAFMMSPSFSREYLLSLRMTEADAIEVLKFNASFRQKRTQDEVIRKNLEKIEQVKQQKQSEMQPTKTPVRRPTEIFAHLETPMIQALKIKDINVRSVLEPVIQPVKVQPKTIKDIPAIQPIAKNNPQPTMLTSTTVLSQSMIPPNPLASYMHQQSPQMAPPQQQAYQQFYPMTGYGQQYPSVQPPPQQPVMQQHSYAGGLPNLSQPRPYMPPQVQPVQQTYHSVHQQPSMQYPVLGTTQVRTEYYGQAMQQPASVGYMVQPQRAAPQAPTGGDKYSIFRYVDPTAPQVLNTAPPPPQNPNAHQQSWHQPP